MSERFFTEKQIAKMLKVAPVTMWRMRKRGVAPPHICVGRKVLYRFDDVLEWCDTQTKCGSDAFAGSDTARAA